MEYCNEKLKALPVQFIQKNGCVFLKRGSTLVKFSGPKAAEILQIIFRKSTGEGATQQEICEEFSPPQYPIVQKLLDKLLVQRFLIPVDQMIKSENGLPASLDVFYWNFGKTQPEVNRRLNRNRIFIVGVNFISQRLSQALYKTGIEDVKIIDDPFLRNLQLFQETKFSNPEKWPEELFPLLKDDENGRKEIKSSSGTCIVATSDFGWSTSIREWNRFSLENNLHFFPVVLSDLMGFVGPLVIPGETACYECLRSRHNSHSLEPEYQECLEESAFAGQLVNGFHPSMASILGDIVAVELMKFYSEIPILRKLGMLVRISLLAPSLETCKILKVPGCSVCSSMRVRSSMNIKI